MSENLGTAVLELRADGSVFDREMGKAEGRATSGASRIGGALKGAAKVAGLAFAGIATAALFGAKKAIDASKALGESVNAVNVVFGKAAGKVLAFGETAAKQAGLSKRAFNELVTPVGAALQNVGYDADQAADASINLAKRAADMASVFNVDVSEALGAIQAGLRGEADPLERFGVGLSDAAVKAKAMEMGLAKSEKELTAGAKTQARVALLMEQTNKLSGDFVKTSDQAANKERIMAAERENDAAAIGDALMPAYTALLHVVAAVTPVLMGFAASLAEKVGPAVTAVVAIVQEKWPQIQATIQSGADAVIDVFSSLAATVMRVVGFFRDHEGATTALLAALGTLAAVVGAYIVVARAVAVVTKAWAAVQLALNVIMAANPFVLIAVAIIGLAAAMVILYKRSETVRDIVDAAFKEIRQVVTTVVNFLQTLWARFGGDITRIATTAFNMVVTVIRTYLNVAKAVITGVLALIHGDWSTAWESLKTVVSTVLSGLGTLITGFATIALTAAKAVGRALVDGILAGVGGLFGMLKGKLESVLKGVLSSINPFSPVEHGGEIYIGRPLAEGVLKGWIFGSAALPEKMAETVRAAVERARQQVESLRGKFSDAWGVLAGDALSAFDAVMGKIETKSEKLLSKLQAQRAAASRSDAVTEARQALAGAQETVATFAPKEDETAEDAALRRVEADKAVAVAQKQLDDALWAQREFALQQRAEQERRELDGRIALRRRKFEERLTDLEAEGQREGMKTSEMHARLTKLYASFGIAYRKSGAALGKAFAEGMHDAEDAVAKAAEALAKVAESRLRLKSPAEKGPLSKLDGWWSSLGATLVKGVDGGGLGGALDSNLAGAAAGAAGGRTFHFHAAGGHFYGTSPRALADELAKVFERDSRAGGGLQA